MIDNLEHIKPLLSFDKDGDFYQLYIFLRKKDQPEGQKDNHQSVRTIKTYCIPSIEYLENKYDEIKGLCEFFKARAYIHIAKQNHYDVGLNMITEIVTRVQSGQYNQKNVFDSVVGQIKTVEKRWIIDVDDKDAKELVRITEAVHATRPEGDKLEAVIPTKSGYHLITKRFDVEMFRNACPHIDIQKKNPTLLFYPNSLDNLGEPFTTGA